MTLDAGCLECGGIQAMKFFVSLDSFTFNFTIPFFTTIVIICYFVIRKNATQHHKQIVMQSRTKSRYLDKDKSAGKL